MDPQPTPPMAVNETHAYGFILQQALRVLVIFFALVGVYATGKFALDRFPSEQSSNQKGCTMEAKVCPDGSAVGRSGPNCEFAPCPTMQPGVPTVTPFTWSEPTITPLTSPEPTMTPPADVPDDVDLPAIIQDAQSWPIHHVCIENSGYELFYQLNDGTNIYIYKGEYVRGKAVVCSNATRD